MTDIQTIKPLLTGTWKGNGYSQYPTLTSAPYLEEFVVSEFEDVQVLQFEQRAWYTNETGEKKKVVFWENGFWVFKNETIQILSSQFSGRFELLSLKKAELKDGKWTLAFETTSVVNDPRVRKSIRTYILSNNELSYSLDMELAHHQVMENHLSATLEKI